MLLSHIIKTVEVFLVEGFPEMSIADMLTNLEGLGYHIANLISLYLAVLFL